MIMASGKFLDLIENIENIKAIPLYDIIERVNIDVSSAL